MGSVVSLRNRICSLSLCYGKTLQERRHVLSVWKNMKPKRISLNTMLSLEVVEIRGRATFSTNLLVTSPNPFHISLKVNNMRTTSFFCQARHLTEPSHQPLLCYSIKIITFNSSGFILAPCKENVIDDYRKWFVRRAVSSHKRLPAALFWTPAVCAEETASLQFAVLAPVFNPTGLTTAEACTRRTF